MAILGLKPTSAPGNTHAVSANTQIATPRGNAGGLGASQIIQAPDHGWITRIGAWAQKVSGAPQAYFAAWSNSATAGNVPDRLLGRSGLRTISTGAANNESAIAVAGGVTASAIRVTSGQVLHLGLTLQGGSIDVGRASTLGILSVAFPVFHRAVSAGTLTDPFTPDGSVATGGLAVYAEFVANSAPNGPTGLTPANGATTNDDTPTLGGAFSDPDVGFGYPDRLWAYEFEVRDNTSDALLWGGATALFAANATEQTAGSYSRPYNGTPLNEGQTVKWRTRCYDLSGMPGAWSAWRTLTLDANANVTLTAPAGKIDGPTEEIGWAGSYNHPSGAASTHMQVRILKDGLVYREGAEFARIVASSTLPGTPFTIDAADDGGVGFLGQGLDLQVQMRAKAAGIWGSWSPPLSFRSNAIPTIPSNLQPPAGSVSTSRPLLTWRSSDADDNEGTEVTWEVEITRPDLQVDTYTATAYDPVTGEASLQMTSTHLPATDPLPYLWRVRANDISASDGLSAWSDPSSFTYSAGILVTVTAPTEGQVITATNPSLTFTIGAGTIVQRRLIVYVKDSSTPKYDTGGQNSSSGVFQIPAGVLLNGNQYDLAVWALNDVGVSGWSARRQITVGFAAPDGVVAPECSPYQFAGDPEPTAVLFSWSSVSLPLDQFRGYAVRRRRSGESLAQATLLKIIPSIAQSRWLDSNAPADGPHIYSASVLKRFSNGDTVESVPAEAEIDLDLRVVVISAAKGDLSRRAVLRWKPSTRRGSYEQEGEDYLTWGGKGLPTAVFGSGTQRIVDGTFTLISDELAEREAHFNALEELYLARVPVIYRDERARFFARIQSFGYDMGDTKDTVTLKLGEIAYQEGEAVSS